MLKRIASIIMILCLAGLALAGCGGSENGNQPEPTKPAVIKTKLPKPKKSLWKYDEARDIYYQAGIDYCEKPADARYERLTFFVPGAYMSAKDNGDGTYTCKKKKKKKINGYTASTAPIVIPVNTPGYSSDKALTEEMLDNYKGYFEYIAPYTSAGFVYIHAGCRGGYEGAPLGVTDLKAAVRYIRYTDDVIAGDAEKIFMFGTSAGAAQSALMGASGNSDLYEPYLKKIGAVSGASDAVEGSMGWCPVTDLDTANAGYEWMMGCSRSGRSKKENAISDKLAEAYAEYVNSAGFVDENGNALTLTESKEGIYQAGSYYDHLLSLIEESLNHYLSDTEFFNGTARDYIDELNSDRKWVAYDEKTNTAKITSVADFVKTCKPASERLFAFDNPEIDNKLFGFGDGEGAHFDRILTDILTELKVSYAADYRADLKKTDKLGNNVEQRVKMYAPLYFLMEGREGYGTTDIAKYWRIRSGIEQRHTAVTTEVNLALALGNCDAVKSVDFETVWAQDHTEAERTGDGTHNFIKWVKDCTKN